LRTISTWWGLALALAAGVAGAQTTVGSTRDDLLAQADAARPESRAAAPSGRSPWRYGIDSLLLEAGSLPDAPEADRTATLRGTAFVLWQPDRTWELRAGALLYGVTQQGGAADYTDWSADVADTYVRWRSGDTRLTLGAQTVLWGRVDEVPLIDRVSRVDLTRFVLDELPDRRRALFALRWEQTWDEVKLDAVALPAFRGAALPDTRSVWSPVNVTTGEVIGIAPTPQLAALVRSATIGEDDGGSGGAAVRLTRAAESFDAGLTLARTRQSIPYYRVDLAAPSLTAIHPYNNFAGVDVEWVTGGVTWRSELAYTDGVPATLPSTAMTMVDAVEWAGAMEFFPGGEETRVNLQLLARSLRTAQPILELKNYLGLNGEVATSFDQGRWTAGVRFAFGLNVSDRYLAPKIAFVGWEPYELSLAAFVFSGEPRTLGGFHRHHDMIVVGLRTRF
jgi:hypothetical protein